MKAVDGQKVCPNCRRELDVSLFHASKDRSDGLRVYCKRCVSADPKKKQHRLKSVARNYRLGKLPAWMYE